ncbi:hypothetical protein Tco_0462564 [Tanacetum coccineum]
MCSYLKNMEGKKLKDLKNKYFNSIQKMFDRAFKRVNTFVDFRTDLVEGSSKRAGEELEQEITKKQKVDEDKDTTKLQSLMEVIPYEEEVAIDAIPLAIKSPSIVGWKIHKEGKKSYYQIINEDLEDLYKLVKAKYKSTRPVDDLDLLLWEDLKTMFEPHVEDIVWRNQQDYKVLEWKLYDSCGVHSLRMQHVYIYMLVEKRYPLTPSTITNMLNKKLQVDYFSEMAYQLLKLLTKQLKWSNVGIKMPSNAVKFYAAFIRVNYKVNAAEGVNAASEEVSTAELESTVSRLGLLSTMSNRHQELASPEQTASGKDFSNPLMADSLPKTIWFSTHHASQNPLRDSEWLGMVVHASLVHDSQSSISRDHLCDVPID